MRGKMENKFLEERHKKFETSEKIVFDLVKKATNLKPLERKKLVRGYVNECYNVKTEKSKEFIVRINQFGGAEFKQEAWIINKCKSKGIPVAKVLLVDKIKSEDNEIEVMVQSKISGQQLEKIKRKLSKNEFAKILFQAGEILSEIHEINVKGFYRRHNGGKWDFPTWEKVMDSAIKDRSAEKEYLLREGFNEKDFNFMIEMIKKLKKDFPCKQPVLCHGDYLPEHIFIDDNLKISGIIDFGLCIGDAPIHDFAFFNLEEPNIDLNLLKKGYKNKKLFGKNFEKELALHKLTLQIGHLAHSSISGDIKQTKFHAKELRKTIDKLKIIMNKDGK